MQEHHTKSLEQREEDHMMNSTNFRREKSLHRERSFRRERSFHREKSFRREKSLHRTMEVHRTCLMLMLKGEVHNWNWELMEVVHNLN